MSSHQDNQNTEPENPNVDAVEQIETLAEGKVAHAVERKSGVQKPASGNEVKLDDFTADLEQKKREQAAAREAVKEQRRTGADVDGSLGQGRTHTEDLRDV